MYEDPEYYVAFEGKAVGYMRRKARVLAGFLQLRIIRNQRSSINEKKYSFTVSNMGEFMHAQGFNLEWQKDWKACFRNGEWKLLLYFGGFDGGLLVMELIRGEHFSRFDEAAEEAERQTFAGTMKRVFDETVGRF